jgi:four helix bundle protein
MGVAIRDVSDLVAYRRSVEFADAVHASAASWGSFDRWTVGVQLVRAADSVGANLSEAWGRDTRADRRRIVFLARGSACEVEHWVRRAEARSLPLPPEPSTRAAELSKLINGLLRAWS